MLVPFLFTLLTGCVGRSMVAAPPTDLVLDQANNYAWSGTLTLANTDVAAGTDFTVDWSGLTTDLYGRSFEGVDHLTLVSGAMSGEDLAQLVITDQYRQSDISAHYQMEVLDGATTAHADDLLTLGVSVDVERLAEDPSQSWLLMWWDHDARPILTMVRQISPRETVTDSSVAVVDGQTTLTNTVDLHTAPPLVATAGPPGSLDWSSVTHDAHGNEMGSVDEVEVARFDVAAVADVEPLFDRLHDEAAELYRATVDPGTTSLALDLAADDAGAAFGGFTTAGVWVVALRCSICSGPPLAAAVVEVN